MLASVALPYAFTRFTDRGVLGHLDMLFDGGSGEIQPGATSGPHQNQLPLYDHVVGFR